VQRGQIAPTANERFLDRVVREIPIAEDEPGDDQQAIDMGGRESPEGIHIAGRRKLDEVRSHPRHLVRADRVDRRLPYDRPVRRNRSILAPASRHRSHGLSQSCSEMTCASKA
jgi:hypothetical protein